MAEVLLRERLGRLGIDANVSSAGEMIGGVQASGGSVRTMAARGLDIADHVSRHVTPHMLASADLVLAMSRRHLRYALAMEPTAFERTFTVKELARRGAAVGPRREQSLSAWLREVHKGRSTVALLGEDVADDVADPMGKPDAQYEHTAVELEALLDRIVGLVFASADRRESA
ncbi:MAG: protein-tyrosine phosphatase [Actinomycetota bacterium]|jgi:protein-tyrosine phosphatase